MHGSSMRTCKNPKNSEFSSNTNMAGGGQGTEPLDEEEEEFDDDFQDNLNPQQPAGNQIINVNVPSAAGVGSSHQHSPATTVMGRSPVLSLKEIQPESSSPIGLTLKRTDSFEELLENRLFALSQASPSREDNEEGLGRGRPRRRTDNLGSPPTSEKLKASNFPIKYIKIGTWERVSEYEGHLVAKVYFAKKRIVWEILFRALKNKIEILWSDISAIQFSIQDKEDGVLHIELNKPPSFFRESNPQPRKHTIWQLASDFTEGQASISRIHTLVFPPGVLNTHIQKLLSCDKRLFELSQQRFPSQESPYFDLATLFGDSTFPIPHNIFGESFASPVSQHPCQPHCTMATRETPGGQATRPATTVLNFPLQNELSRMTDMYRVGNQGFGWRNVSIGNGGPQHVSSQAQDNMAMITSSSSSYHRVATALDNIEEHLLGNVPQVVYPDESTTAAHITRYPSGNPYQSRMDYRTNHTASTSRQVTMLDENESYNLQRFSHGFPSQAMNRLQPPPPPTPDNPTVMRPEVNNVVPSLMPNDSSDFVLFRFMQSRNPTNRVGFPTAYYSRDPKIE
ncbi:UNVERIFIED_CONTAM: hypothetical protein Sradi_1493500 [Sesamum radiatum]|uniref:TRF2/HOY1 PH-like domain-containing protein n=1 Tax=Sesamum radiatum TaxID=300843 RepID=A0AAW2U771_SESRA